MSDDKPQDDEDLMSDFKDLFPEDEQADTADTAADGEPEETQDGDEALDELDAFLDDFEKGFNPADEVAADDAEVNAAEPEPGANPEVSDEEGAPQPPEEEAPVLTEEVDESELAAASQGEREELPLGKEELDLAMSEAESSEVFDDHWGDTDDTAEADSQESAEAGDEPASEDSSPKQEEPVATRSVEADPLEEVAALASGAPPAAAPQTAQSGGGMNRTMLWSVISVMLVALGLSAASAWLAFSTASQVEHLASSVQQMQQQRGVRGSSSGLNAVRTELRTLGARVNELAVVIEGPMSHLRESNNETLSDIEKRLARLEQAVSAKPAAQPLVEKKATAPAEPVSVPSEPTKKASTGWAINLISLSSEKDANKELKHLKSLGVRVEKQRVVKDGKVWYRLRVPGFASYEGAKAYIDTVEKKAGVKNAWVAKE